MRISFKQILLLVLIFCLFFIREIGKQAYLLNIRWLYLVVLSFLISYFLTPFTIQLAIKFNILDYPAERKIHLVPIPRIGGVAVFIAMILSLLRNLQFAKEILGLIIGISMIFIVGILDDIYGLSAIFRLIVQILSTMVVIAFGFRITVIPVGFPIEYVLEVLITIIWFVGITNAINFLDGIDGLVSGLGAFCSLMFLIISLTTQQKFISYLCATILGSCLGFIPYNWHKAKTFLGECGSSVIGFSLAGVSVVGWWAEKNPIISLSIPVMILSVPIYDMIYITISRIRNGLVKNFKEWLEYVGKDHLHHRLLKLGFSMPQAVLFILLLTFTAGYYSILLKYINATSITVIFILFHALLIFVLISIIMYVGAKGKK